MNRVLVSATWAVCAALAATCTRADPRDVAEPLELPTPEQAEARRIVAVAAMEAWLRRLVGRYSYSGTEEVPPASCTTNAFGMDNPRTCTESKPREAHGLWDCIGVGTGAGVHCVFGATAAQRTSEMTEDDFAGLAELNMDAPTMILFGIDPDVPTLRYMRIDEDGIAYEADGDLRGNTASFRKKCLYADRMRERADKGAACLEIFRIEAREDKPPQVIIDWVDAAADYNSVALLQLWLRPAEPAPAPSDREL